MTYTLTVPCVMPGCQQPIVHTGDVCETCKAEFGPMLQHSDAPRMTADEIRARDHAVHSTYARRSTP